MSKKQYIILELHDDGKIRCTHTQNRSDEHILFSNSKMSLVVDQEIKKNEMEYNLNLMRAMLEKALRDK